MTYSETKGWGKFSAAAGDARVSANIDFVNRARNLNLVFVWPSFRAEWILKFVFKDFLPKMAAILQKLDATDLRCFQHNTVFLNKDLFDEHLKECEKLCLQINVCNFAFPNGQMCGKSFKKTTTLINS